MNIIYVDDEQIQRENFRLTVKGMEGMESLKLFGSSVEAYEWAKEHPVDVAFLDIEMPHMDGLELTRKLKELNRDTRVVIVTAYEPYSLEAFRARATAYLLKPYSREDIEKELENALYHYHTTDHPSKKKIQIVTMPDLLVTINGRTVFKGHSKQEELFALLVDRGGKRRYKRRGTDLSGRWKAAERQRLLELDVTSAEYPGRCRSVRSDRYKGLCKISPYRKSGL